MTPIPGPDESGNGNLVIAIRSGRGAAKLPRREKPRKVVANILDLMRESGPKCQDCGAVWGKDLNSERFIEFKGWPVDNGLV